MSGHDSHDQHPAAPQEDHTITVKVGLFLALVVISLIFIGMIN